MMQPYAEGFDILRNKDSKDLPEDERFAGSARGRALRAEHAGYCRGLAAGQRHLILAARPPCPARVIHTYPTQAEAIKMPENAYARTRMTPMLKFLSRRWLAR